MSDEPHGENVVQLGEETFTVVAQPYPRLFRQLSAFGDELQEMGETTLDDAGTVVAVLGSRVHAFLRIFIPDLMAEWRFAGYPSPEAFERGAADEASESRAPTIPQIIGAVETAFAVNGGKRLGDLLGKLLGPAMGQAAQRLVAARISELLSQGSTSSPSPNGGASPDGSTTPQPTRVPVGSEPPTADAISSAAERASAGSPSLVS